MLIFSPAAQLNGGEIQIAEVRGSKSGSLGNDIGTHIVLDPFRSVVLRQFQQLINQDLAQCSSLCIKFIINLLQQSLIRSFGATRLNNAREQTLADNHALQRGRSLQRSILHITSLVTENGTEQFFLRRRIGLALGRNLTYKDVARFDARTDTDNTIVVQILGCLFTDIGDIRGQFFHTTLGFANLQRKLLHMNRRQQVLSNDPFVQHNGILVVISLPRHISNQKVLTQRQFTILRRIALSQDLAFGHTLTLVANRTQVNRHILVRATPLRNSVFLQRRLEADKFFVLRTVIQNANSRGIHKVNHTVAFSRNLCARIAGQLTLDARAHDRSLGTQQRNSLAHHVRSHQSAVGVIMLQERNQRSRNRSNLLGRNIHQFHF